MLEDVEDIVLVSEPVAKRLNPRQRIAYRKHRRDLAERLVHQGKEPKTATGHALTTVEARMKRLEPFYRFVWDVEGRCTTDITMDYVDAWMEEPARSSHGRSYEADCQKAVNTLFKWQRHARDLME